MWFLKKLFSKREEAARAYSASQNGDGGDGDVVKPFLDHLEDLRWMIIKMIFTLGIAMTVAFTFRTHIAHVLNHPLAAVVGDVRNVLIITGPIDSITVSFTLSFYTGIVVSFPLLFYFLAGFILPALTKKEKRYILPGIGVGFLLFLGGVLLSYYLVLPATLHWLYSDAQSFGKPQWTIREYYGFVTHLSIAIGLVCELPVVLVTLNSIGLMSAQWLRGMRMYGYAFALILAMLISPTPDVFMLFIFALPIMVLFEGCIWLVWLLEKRRAARESRLSIDPNEPID